MQRSSRRWSIRRFAAWLGLASAAVVVSLGCETIDVSTSPKSKVPVYGLFENGIPDPDVIANQFIVVLPHEATSKDRESVERRVKSVGADVLDSRDSTLQVFLAEMSPDVLEQVRLFSNIAWIEANRYGERTGLQPGLQTCPGWNLDMLDQQSNAPMLDDVYAYSKTGNGATVVVVDTGLNTSNFNGAVDGKTRFPGMCGSADKHGHGTMVAQVVAGQMYGVAKNVTIMGYNADCQAVCGDLPVWYKDYAALDEIRLQMGKKNDDGTYKIPRPLIVVLPHTFNKGEPDPNVIEDAIRSIIGHQGIVITAAGNGGADACGKTPAYLSQEPDFSKNVITVGGFAQNGTVGAFNSGKCVDLFAPAWAIRTLRPMGGCGPAGETTVSGTSYAAAHVAGVASLLLEDDYDPSGLKDSLLAAATRKIVLADGLPESPEVVLHSPYNAGESNTVNDVDADGWADKIKFCEGPGCTICEPSNGSNACNQTSIPAECKARMHCTGTGCARCGYEGDQCCWGAPPCEWPLVCEGDTCVGSCVTNCCDGQTFIVNETTDAACIQDGGETCWAHSGPAEIRNKGMKIWGPNACPSLEETKAICCDGEEISLGMQFDVDVAMKVAAEECNKGTLSVVRALYMNGQLVGSNSPDACGKCDVLCCDGTSVGGDYGPQNPPNACLSFGGLACAAHGSGPQKITYDGTIIWSKGTAACPTMRPCIITCTDGTQVFVGDHFSEIVCKDVASTQACGSPQDVLVAQLCGVANGPCCTEGDTACIDKDLTCINNTCKSCGADMQACCSENGQKDCNGIDLQCVGGKCTGCGKSGATCCQGANGPYCVDAGLSCINTKCTGCGAEDQACCVGDAGSYCAGFDLQCDDGLCHRCGSNGQDCCASPNGAYCMGPGISCSDKTCTACGNAVDQPCCGDGGQWYCYGNALRCFGGFCKDCGRINQASCPDGSCRDELDNVGGICKGVCTARCVKGELVQTTTQATTKDACVAWATLRCPPDFGDKARVFFNGALAFNLDAQFPGNCGEDNRYCCYTTDDLDQDGIDDKCQNYDTGARCIKFTPPSGTVGKQRCSKCGYSGASCCQDSANGPKYCALGKMCSGNTCTP